MLRYLYPLCLLALFACQPASQTESNTPSQEPSLPYVDVLDSALLDILDPTSPIETLGTGYNWSEGPLWLPRQKRLIFSDVPENKIYQWVPGQGVSLYLEMSGSTGIDTTSSESGSNGLTLDLEGRLILCQHGDRRVAMMDEPLDAPMPSYITLADKYEGKKLNSPNDLAYDPEGRLYFTDPPYGLNGQDEDPSKELSANGVYLLTQDGDLTLLTEELTRPNGIAFSPDYKTLYVAQSDPKRAIWMQYPVLEDGTIGKGSLLRDVTDLIGQAGEKGLPDGLKVHQNGTIFATGPGGVLIMDPNGKLLGKIRTGQATANCAFDEHQQHLYMTADSLLMRIAIKPVF